MIAAIDAAFLSGFAVVAVIFLVGRLVIRRTRREISRGRADWTD